jgi:hypothetical protein
MPNTTAYQFVLLKDILFWGEAERTPYTLWHKFMHTWICASQWRFKHFTIAFLYLVLNKPFFKKLPQCSLCDTLRPMTWTPMYPGPSFVQVNFMSNTITLTLVVFENITFYFLPLQTLKVHTLQTLKVHTLHTLRPSFVKTWICTSHWWYSCISIPYSYRNLQGQNIKRGAGMDHHNHFIFYPLFQMFKWSYF